MFGGYQGMMDGGGWVVMMILWIALLALIVWAVVRLVPARRTDRYEPREIEPSEILDRRLALGEIDADEYRQVRSTLADPVLAGKG